MSLGPQPGVQLRQRRGNSGVTGPAGVEDAPRPPGCFLRLGGAALPANETVGEGGQQVEVTADDRPFQVVGVLQPGVQGRLALLEDGAEPVDILPGDQVTVNYLPSDPSVSEAGDIRWKLKNELATVLAAATLFPVLITLLLRSRGVL